MNILKSGEIGSGMFITNVGLITSNGPAGPNVMTAAWTHHISYEPPLIMVNTHQDDTTSKNIIATGVFGVNLASSVQNVLASIAGKYSGSEVDKVALLKELGFAFYDGRRIRVPMIKGAALNAELRLIKHEPMGDHITLIGAVIESSVSKTVKPMAYHAGKYWNIGTNIPKPEQKILDTIPLLAEKYKRYKPGPTELRW